MKIADSGRFTLFVSKDGFVIGAAPPKETELRRRKDDVRRERFPLAEQVGKTSELLREGLFRREKPPIRRRPHDRIRHEQGDEEALHVPLERYIQKYGDLMSQHADDGSVTLLPSNTTFGYYVAAILLKPISLSEWQDIVMSSDTWEEAALSAVRGFRGFPLIADGLSRDALRGFRDDEK